MIGFIFLHLDVDIFRCLKKMEQNNFQKSITLEKKAGIFALPIRKDCLETNVPL